MPANPKPPKPIRDSAYTRDAQNRRCMAIDRTDHSGDVVAAHINIAGNFGMSRKASDDETVDLCVGHHDEFDGRRGTIDETMSRYMWLVRNILIPQRRAAYRKWRAER